MIFVVAFLGSLFAILVSLLIVYSYLMLRLVPRIKRGMGEFIEKSGAPPSTAANPDAFMRQLDITGRGAARVVFTCEDHGRCDGCPKILAQFEAIIRHQGIDTFDDVEIQSYEQLCAKLGIDPIQSTSEVARQRTIAARVVETLVREGIPTRSAHEAVWRQSKEVRATHAAWLSAARASCKKGNRA